jgi:hypothetical protein
MKEHNDSVQGKGLLSENELYFVPNDGSRIYIKSGATGPLASKDAGRRATATVGDKTYQGYESAAFYRDCLHTAEEIINGKQFDPGKTVSSKVKATGDDFGDTDAKNIVAANKSALNDAASPGAGEAYVIVNTKWGKGNKGPYPYHAAGVVAVDGKDRITLEVFATDKDAKDRNTKGDYRMYTTEGTAATFHSHWKNQFQDDTVTTVIVKKS